MPNAIKEIMREVGTVSVNETFLGTLKKMINKKTNSLVVVDDEGKVVGMINTGRLIKQVVPDYLETDATAAHFANKEIFVEEVKRSKKVSISEFMIKDPVTVDSKDSLMEAAVLAISSKQLRLPVVDKENKPIGLITRTELKQVIGEILDIECFTDCS